MCDNIKIMHSVKWMNVSNLENKHISTFKDTILIYVYVNQDINCAIHQQLQFSKIKQNEWSFSIILCMVQIFYNFLI